MTRTKIVVFSTLIILIISLYAQAGPVPDTGQTTSSTETFGEDSDYLINPPSYTKLDANGNELADSVASWTMVRDNVTGLIWEVKTDDGSVHDKDNKYTWYDSNPNTNGGDAGTPGNRTDTEDFINKLNSSNYGGHSDWRMPTIDELPSIIDYGTYYPAIDDDYFPNTMSSDYWSSTTRNKPGVAWRVDFNHGSVNYNEKSFTYYVRAVRGGQSGSFDKLVSNGDSTVTDTATGLMWQQETSGTMNWGASLGYCENLSLAGYSDWRLPTAKELASIVDHSKFNPAIDSGYFPNTKSSYYWSSTIDANNNGKAWLVYFITGHINNLYKSNTYYVRAVRGGQSGSFGNSDIWYKDSDSDGFGDPNNLTASTSQPSGYVADKTDCNDNDATIYPGATEIPNDNIDQDCVGGDSVNLPTWYYDSDGDGFGDLNDSLLVSVQPKGYVANSSDCNDTDATIHPGATEIPDDTIDQDCNGSDAVSTGIWYYDSDGDGYGDYNDSLSVSVQPKGYVSDNTDCDDTNASIHPGATEIAGDGIDQDCNGSDQTSTTTPANNQIYAIAPANNETLSFGSANGQLTFSFTKITDATKYFLYFELNDLINHTTIPISSELIPPGSGNSATQGFSESFVGMTYNIPLDSPTWDSMALYNIKWGVEAFNSSGALVGSTYESSIPNKYVSNIKFLASTAIALTSPSPGSTLVLSDSAPVFKWDLYSGVTAYELILARVDGLSFSPVLPFPNLTLNLLTMDDATWQSMPAGKWYWTVLGKDSIGNQMPSKFTIFDFEVTGQGTPIPAQPPVQAPTNIKTNSLGMDFVSITPGTFTMGSPTDEPGRYINETQHQVTLTKGYYMQTTEVTQGQWEAVMGSNPSSFSGCGLDCPVEKVSWNYVHLFIDKLNQLGEGLYMLPTEAQWEYAARAGAGTAFANGEITELGSGYDPNLDAMGWYVYNSNKTIHPVAQKTPNTWGLYDMHGNVLECVQDWYGDHSSSSVTDPIGPSSGSYRVIRGGSWDNIAKYSRAAFRSAINPDYTPDILGFRLVLSSDQEPTPTSKTWYIDSDGDGYGNSANSLTSSAQPYGYVSDNTDCNDNDAIIHPGATEIAGDEIDQDCNGSDLASSDSTCGAYVALGVWKEFDCYNLAAIGKTTNDDPFTPSWRLIGGYWQWGRKGPDSSQWYDTNTANFAHGPTGPGLADANDGSISSWDDNYAPDDSWSDTYKTAHDPCPAGYRVPTQSQWEGVINNNTQSTVGTWSESTTNYSSAYSFGDDLMLPSVGYRFSSSSGSLYYRGYLGYYWSSTQSTSGSAWRLGFSSSPARADGSHHRKNGLSVRCVAE